MDKKQVAASLKVAACVCGKDGLISQVEEESIIRLITQKCPNITEAEINVLFDEFFDSNEQIEDYLKEIESKEIRDFTIMLSKESASADGLDLKENIALQKVCLFWGVNLL